MTKCRTDYPFMDEIREDYRIKIQNGEINARTKVPFICNNPDHFGFEYWQELHSHLAGHSCPKCVSLGNSKRFTKRDYPFMDEIRPDYQEKIKNGEINNRTKIPFICSEHGEYWQQLSSHKKHKCPYCAYESRNTIKRRVDYPFINEIREDYRTKVQNGEIGNKIKVPFICKEHGEYWQNLDSHYSKNCGCPKCAKIISKSEIEVFKYVKSILPNIEVQSNIRHLLLNSQKELDIYIPSLKIGIEYNGLIWHSEKFARDKYNLLTKTKEFNNIGIRVIHIFEDEWLFDQYNIKNKLFNILTNNDKIKNHILIEDNKQVVYADLRFYNINDNIYLDNKFIQHSIIKPICYYIKGTRRIQYIENDKYYKIYDCGHIKYIKEF